MQINRTTLRQFRSDFDSAVQALSQQYGVAIELGNIRFDQSKFGARIEVTNKTTTSGTSLSNEQAVFEANIPCFGGRYTELKPQDYGKLVTIRGTQYKIVGYKPSSRKYPVILQTVSSGTRYKFTAREVINALDTQNTAPTAPIHIPVTTPNITVTSKVATSIGLIYSHNSKLGRAEQVKHYMNAGLTSASEIAGLLGTNASYVARLMK